MNLWGPNNRPWLQNQFIGPLIGPQRINALSCVYHLQVTSRWYFLVKYNCSNFILTRSKIRNQATVASWCYLPIVPLFPLFVYLSLCGVYISRPHRNRPFCQTNKTPGCYNSLWEDYLGGQGKKGGRQGWGRGCAFRIGAVEIWRAGRCVCACVSLCGCLWNSAHTVNRLL